MQHGAFDNIPEHIKDAVFTDIADQLLDDWIQSNLDESVYHADLQIAYRSGDITFQRAFNEHYQLTEKDEDYFHGV